MSSKTKTFVFKPEKLLQSKLWPGSGLELAHRYGYLTCEMVEAKIKSLETCGDCTPGETAMLKALREDLQASVRED